MNAEINETPDPSQTTPEVVQEPADDEPKAGNPEAAKYRTRLRETEAERDALAGQVETLRRSIVDREIEAKHGIKPAALWASGTELADVLDDDGQLDTDKLGAAVATAKETLGLPKRRAVGPYVPREGNTPARPKGDSWADAFSTNNR